MVDQIRITKMIPQFPSRISGPNANVRIAFSFFRGVFHQTLAGADFESHFIYVQQDMSLLKHAWRFEIEVCVKPVSWCNNGSS